jgi:hypothetical protein
MPEIVGGAEFTGGGGGGDGGGGVLAGVVYVANSERSSLLVLAGPNRLLGPDVYVFELYLPIPAPLA